MSNHSDKSYPERPISELARTGHRISHVRTHHREADQFAANAIIRRALRVPHAVATRRTSPSTSPSRSRPIPSPSLAPQGLQMLEQYSAPRAYSGALASPMSFPSHLTRHRQPTSRPPTVLSHYPSSPLFMTPPIPYTQHATSQHVPPRHRSGASDDARSTSSARDVRQIDGYLADDSSSGEDTADRANVETGDCARNCDVAADSGDKEDLAIDIEHSDSTRSDGDGDTSAHGSLGEHVDVDELDSEEYVDVRTRYHHTDIWDDAQGLYTRIYRNRDGRQEEEVLCHYSLIKQREAGGFPSAAAYPLTGEREAGPSSSVDEHDGGDEERVHHPPQVDLQIEEASWTSTSATMSSSGITSQREPVAPPAIIRPSIHNLINAEDMEVPRPWGSSALTEADQHADPYATAPREAKRLVDTSPTYPAATDATGQGGQTPAANVTYSIPNYSPILLGPGSQLSLRMSLHSPTPPTEPAVPSEDFTGAAEHGAAEHGAPDRSSPWPSDADLRVAGPFLEFIASARATGVWSSPGTGNGRLYPDTGNVLSPGATSESATLTGGTINIDLPKVDPFATAPASVLHDSTQFGQQGQSSRPPLAQLPSPHPPSPRSRPPSPSPLPSSAPQQDSPSSQPSPPSDHVGWVNLWHAKVKVVQQAVNGEFEVDEAGQSYSSPAEHAATLPSTTRTAVAPLNEGSGEKGKKKGVGKKKKTPPSKARQAFVKSIKLGGPWLLNAVRMAYRLTGEPFPEEAMVPDDNLNAGLQERSDASPGIVQDGIATSRGLEGAASDQSVDDIPDTDEEGLELEHQGEGEQGEESRCHPFLLYVVPRSEDETVEEALQRGQGEIHEQVQTLFFESRNRAIATDRNNPPIVDTQGQAGPSTSAQPPARGPMNPVYPAQTRVVVFVACENAYTFTVAELGDDESPLRAPDGSEGNNKKKGAKKSGKKGGKKGNKKGGQQDQDPLEMLPRRRFNSPADIPVNYGDWNVPTRSAVEARAMEAEGIPEELQAELTNNSGPAQVDATAGGGGNVRGRQDEDLSGCGAGASQGSRPRDERQPSREGQEQDSEDEEAQKKKKNAKPPPPLRSRREILEEHQEWLPIRYDDRTLGQDLRVILAEVHYIIRVSYSPRDPVFGAHLINNLNSTQNAAQNTDSSTEGRVTRSKDRKRPRAESEDEGGNDAGPSQPAKKRKGKTAAATSSQQAPAASLPQPPATRGNKRRRDEATEDAAPAPKRTRTTRDDEASGGPPARPSTTARSQAPRMIAPPGTSVELFSSLQASQAAAAEALQARASMSQQPPRAPMPRQPPRPFVYRPPPEQPIAGPSRLPMAGPSRPSRKRRRGDETDEDDDDSDYVEEGGPVTWESGRRAKKPKKQ